MKSKIKYLSLLTYIFIASLLISGCIEESSVGEGNELPLVRYGGQHYPGEYVLAGSPDIWNKYGIQVDHTLFSSGAENSEALITERVDINCGSDTKTVALFNAMQGDIIIIGTLQKGNRYSTVVRTDSEIESWDDLKGKKVATRYGTGAESILRKYYEMNGYNWEDFDYVNMKIEDMPAALESGQIDAFTAWEITPSITEAKGIGTVMRTYGDVALTPVSIHTTKEYASQHEDEIVRFLAAHLEKAELIQNNPEEAATLATNAASERGANVLPEAFERVFNRINFELDVNEETIGSINDTALYLYEEGKIETIPTIEYDASYLEKAKQLRTSME